MDEDIHYRIFRVWYDDMEDCDYVFLTQFISLGNGDYLIGMQPYDNTKDDDKYPVLYYRKLSDIKLSYYPEDQDE